LRQSTFPGVVTPPPSSMLCHQGIEFIFAVSITCTSLRRREHPVGVSFNRELGRAFRRYLPANSCPYDQVNTLLALLDLQRVDRAGLRPSTPCLDTHRRADLMASGWRGG
jgi:hypothetical protein